MTLVSQEGGSRPIGPSPLGARLPSNTSVVSSQVPCFHPSVGCCCCRSPCASL
jgi:hypothetical protein